VPGPDSADARACGALPSFPNGTAAEIMAGRLTIAPFKAVVIDPHTDGDIDWAMNPYHDPTWVLDFQTGTWIEALVEAYLAGGRQAASYRARAKAILTGWLDSVPLANKNPETLMCSAEAFPGQAWIHDKIPVLLNYYAAHWQGAYNHGLSQDLELLRAGCAYPASEWGGRPLFWRKLARQQMIESFEPNKYGPAVDAQGATNEQSTGYENFNLGLWTEAEADLAACRQAPLPAADSARVAKMTLFLALATQPDGRLVQIGDTYAITPRDRAGTPLQFAATMGAAGTPPRQRVGVYAAGYVFGRSGWGTRASFGQMSFYSLRFGPGRQIHGHDDHLGLTYYARGRNLIVDAGHDGYDQNAYRAYLLSPEAASTLVMPGVPFDASAATSLVASDIGGQAQFFEFTDTAFRGHVRDRSVYVSQAPDFIVVFDRASGGGVYQQLWHLDPSLTVRTVRAGYAVATAAGTELVIRQVALPGQVIPAGSTQVLRGQVKPYQGWVSRGQNQRTPAPVVTMTRRGASASILTVIVPAAPGTAVTASAAAHGPGWYLLRLAIGGAVRTLLVSAHGAIKAGLQRLRGAVGLGLPDRGHLSGLARDRGVLGEDQPADQAKGVDEVAEAFGGAQGEHQGQADRQPPGGGAQVAGRADYQRQGHRQAGGREQADREVMAERAGARQQVPWCQARRRSQVAGEAEREEHRVLHRGDRAGDQRGNRGRDDEGQRRKREPHRLPGPVAVAQHGGHDRDGQPGGRLHRAGQAQRRRGRGGTFRLGDQAERQQHEGENGRIGRRHGQVERHQGARRGERGVPQCLAAAVGAGRQRVRNQRGERRSKGQHGGKHQPYSRIARRALQARRARQAEQRHGGQVRVVRKPR
jgi:hypothetical protein